MDRRPLAFLSLQRNLPIVRVHHVFHDLGAQPGAACLAADGAAGEKAVADFWWHAAPGVDDEEVNSLIGQIDVPPDGDGAAARYRRDGDRKSTRLNSSH